jgi:hypothetical protein
MADGFWDSALARSIEYHGKIRIVLRGQLRRVHHYLKGLDPNTTRRGNTCLSGRRSPPSDASQDQCGGNCEQFDLAHLNLLSLLVTLVRVWLAQEHGGYL